MSRRQQLSLVLGCALFLCLEAPGAWRVLAADLARATAPAPAPARAELALAPSPRAATTERASLALSVLPVPPSLSAPAAHTGPAPR